MTHRRKIFFIFSGLALAHLGYLALYHYLLNLPITALSAFYSLSGFAVSFIVILIQPKRILLLLNSLAHLLLSSYQLASFAHYKVFQVFIEPSLSQVKATNLTLIKFLADYLGLIPWQLVAASLLVLILTIVAYSEIIRTHKKPTAKKIFSIYNEDQEPAHQPLSLAKLAGLSFSILLAIILTAQYFVVSPRASWWDQRNFAADLGTNGFLWNQIAGTGKYIAERLFLPKTSLANEQEFPLAEDTASQNKQLPGQELKGLIYALNNQRVPEEKEEGQLNKMNIIFYQLESADSWVTKLDPNPMPNLSRLMAENISSKTFVSNSCETVNAEYTTLCSSFSDSFRPINYDYKDNHYYCLPSVLKEKAGYYTALFHAGDISFYDRNILGKSWGFDNLYFNDVFTNKEPDGQVIKKMVEELKVNAKDRPFLGYLIGYTSHSPHSQEMYDYFKKVYGLQLNTYQGVLPEQIQKSLEADPQTARYYAGMMQYIDESIASLFDELKRQGLDKNTIVVMYGDHRYYNFSGADKISDFHNYNDLPFVIVTPNQIHKQLSVASNIDIAPTILDLLNISAPKNFVGTSLLSPAHPQNAVTKCLGNIEFVNQRDVIRGNVRANRYGSLQTDTGREQIDNITNKLRKFLDLSDFFLKSDTLWQH